MQNHQNFGVGKDPIYVCPSCGFKTNDVSEIHEENSEGGMTHFCPKCRAFTGSGSDADWETRSADLSKLETQYEVVYLSNAAGQHKECLKCFLEK